MASFASIRHQEWRTQAAWTKKVGENNGPLRFRPPGPIPQGLVLVQALRKYKKKYVYASLRT